MDGWVSIDGNHLGVFRFFVVEGGWNFMLVFLEDLWVYGLCIVFLGGRVGIHACINLYP